MYMEKRHTVPLSSLKLKRKPNLNGPEYQINDNLNYFLLLTMSRAEVSACPAELVARHVNTPASSSYVVAIRRTTFLPSWIIYKGQRIMLSMLVVSHQDKY